MSTFTQRVNAIIAGRIGSGTLGGGVFVPGSGDPPYYEFDITTGLTPTVPWVLDLIATEWESTTSIDMIVPEERLDIWGGDFRTYRRVVQNSNTTDTPLSLRVFGSTAAGGANNTVNIECPIVDVVLLGTQVTSSSGYTVRIGNNTLALQPGWWGPRFIAGYYEDITAIAGNEVAGIISYAEMTLSLGNVMKNFTGESAQDTGFVYYKSPRGRVGYLLGSGIDQPGTPRMNSVNLKGDKRDGVAGTPKGFGATASNISLLGSGKGSAVQMETDEAAVVDLYAENFLNGILGGSGTHNYSMVLGARLHHLTGGASTQAQSFGGIDGLFALNVAGISRGFRDGIEYTVPTGKTFQGISVANQLISGESNALGAGLKFSGVDTDSILDLNLSNLTIKSFLQGINLTNVKGASLVGTTFIDVGTPTKPIFLVTCKNIRGTRAHNIVLQTTDATATLAFQLGNLAAGNVLKISAKAKATKSDVSAVGSLSCDFTYKNVGGVTSLVTTGVLTNDGGNLLPVDALSGAVSSDIAQVKIKGIAAETWNWELDFDFELL